MSPKELTDYYGNQTLAAAAAGVTQGTVSDWVTSGRIPDKRQLHIERITDGKLKADDGCLDRVLHILPAKQEA